MTTTGPFVETVSNAITKVTGIVPALSTTGGTSDACFIKDYCPVIEFGLLSQQMHKIDEHVATKDLVALTAIYRHILERYFSSSSSQHPRQCLQHGGIVVDDRDHLLDPRSTLEQ